MLRHEQADERSDAVEGGAAGVAVGQLRVELEPGGAGMIGFASAAGDGAGGDRQRLRVDDAERQPRVSEQAQTVARLDDAGVAGLGRGDREAVGGEQLALIFAGDAEDGEAEQVVGGDQIRFVFEAGRGSAAIVHADPDRRVGAGAGREVGADERIAGEDQAGLAIDDDAGAVADGADEAVGGIDRLDLDDGACELVIGDGRRRGAGVRARVEVRRDHDRRGGGGRCGGLGGFAFAGDQFAGPLTAGKDDREREEGEQDSSGHR